MSSLLAPVRWVGRMTTSFVSAIGRGALLSVDAGRSIRKVDMWGRC
ncbi:MAG TPA: hypothetical protein VJ925_03050 [Longimicrobiales bacterium]|nr:hypothetical protein [Longimicrobiales bacterium]